MSLTSSSFAVASQKSDSCFANRFRRFPLRKMTYPVKNDPSILPGKNLLCLPKRMDQHLRESPGSERQSSDSSQAPLQRWSIASISPSISSSRAQYSMFVASTRSKRSNRPVETVERSQKSLAYRLTTVSVWAFPCSDIFLQNCQKIRHLDV